MEPDASPETSPRHASPDNAAPTRTAPDEAALARLRDSDKRAIATWVLIACVGASFALLLVNLAELLFAPEFDWTRCASYHLTAFEADQKLWTYVSAFFLFAAGVFAENLRAVYRWRFVVIVAIVGVALAILANLLLTLPRVEAIAACVEVTDTSHGPWVTKEYETEVTFDDMRKRYLQDRVRGLYNDLAIWFGWVVVSQMGLNLDGAAKVAEAIAKRRQRSAQP